MPVNAGDVFEVWYVRVVVAHDFLRAGFYVAPPGELAAECVLCGYV
jgi:hypothetical protein